MSVTMIPPAAMAAPGAVAKTMVDDGLVRGEPMVDAPDVYLPPLPENWHYEHCASEVQPGVDEPSTPAGAVQREGDAQ